MHALAAAALTVFTVAPGGSDAGPGTAAQPWRTISKAARTVPPGSVVDVRGGVYPERVVVRFEEGDPDRPIVFVVHSGEKAVIDGSNVRAPAGGGPVGLIDIHNSSHVEFRGFELRGLADRAARERFTPAGVWVRGSGRGIVLRDLDIHDISTRRGNAHGIAVYGTSGARSLSNVRIEGNSVHDLKLGASEAIAVNGNVDGWSVTGNRVDDVDNIGIDAIGFETTAPRAVDRARNGVISGNVVSDVDTIGNFAYDEEGGNCRCAGGIYVDGGARILIERNRVTRSNLGIELASEHRTGITSDVLVRNNVVMRSDRAGLTMGGFDERRGQTVRARVLNNTFLDNDQGRNGVGEVELNYRVLNSQVRDNVFRSRRGGILLTNGFTANRGNVFDGNTWFTPGRTAATATWQWRTRTIRGFAAWRRAVGGEARGRYADPG